MGNRVQILSVKRNQIIRKVKRKHLRMVTRLCLVAVISFVTFFSVGGVGVSQLCNSMCYIYNPVNSLYSDNSNIIFTNVNAINKEILDFVVPITGAESHITARGDIEFTITNSIMVKTIEGGVVEEVGTTIDGVKYIKILHSLDVYSLIENVDILGVSKGEIVKKGQDIATAKVGHVVVLKLFDGNTQINNLVIKHSKILWEK